MNGLCTWVVNYAQSYILCSTRNLISAPPSPFRRLLCEVQCLSYWQSSLNANNLCPELNLALFSSIIILIAIHKLHFKSWELHISMYVVHVGLMLTIPSKETWCSKLFHAVCIQYLESQFGNSGCLDCHLFPPHSDPHHPHKNWHQYPLLPLEKIAT